MRYLTIRPDCTDSCLSDDFGKSVSIEDLDLPKNFINAITDWHNNYRKIIPLDSNERLKHISEIEKLDAQGLRIASKLQELIHGGAKIKYFSEGKLAYLPVS